MKVLTTTGLTKLIELSKGTFLDKNNVIDVSDALATVALTGSYNDLSNKPTIPTVDQTYDSTSTNAQSGTAVASAVSNKVDKVSTASKVYGTDGSGAQTTYSLTSAATAGTIAYRTTDGVLSVGTPTSDAHAATKKYVDDSVAAVIPSQTGNSGKYLTTNGIAVSWATVDALPSQTGNSGKYLTTNGTTASWDALAAVANSGSYTDLSDKPTINDLTTAEQQAALNSGATSTNIAQITTNKNNISTINSKIPSAASSSNQLADKDFVNSSINAIAAYYITSDAEGDAFATKAALDTGPYYHDGSTRTPTENDYAIVAADETHDNACTRYSYTGSQWSFQYIVNDTPFTQAQIDAINSGITSTKVSNYDTHIADTTIHVTSTDKSNWNAKQAAITGAASTVTSNDLTASRVLVSNSSGKITADANITTTELSYLDGVTSSIQTQLNSKQATLVSSGTGQNIKTINNNDLLGSGNITIDSLPAQSGNSGKILTTNGTAASWATIGDSGDVIPYGTSDTAAATVQKEVSIPSITSLKTGQIIIVQPSITSTVANSTLKLNSFPAYPMLYNNTAITTSTDSIVWGATFPSMWRFDGSNWVFLGHGLDSNSTYTINYSIDAGQYKAGAGSYPITRYSLIAQKEDGTWEKITKTNATYSTSTTKAVNPNGFRLGQIRYHSAKTEITTAGALVATNTIYNKAASVDMRYSTNCGTTTTWALGDYIYLVGTIGVDGLFYLSSPWWSNTLPTTNDGKLYIRLGLALAAAGYTMSFFEDRPIFYHDGTKIREYIQADNKQDLLVSGTNIKTINNQSIVGSGNLVVDGLPSQSGQNGKYLKTDGSSASWATVDTLPSQSGQSGKYLTTNGTAASWATLNIPTTTNAITSGSTAALTSGGAYTNVVTGVEAGTTNNKINVTKAGTTSTITINNVANATTASKLGSTTVGGVTQPIYLDSGTPTALSYTIEKSVPSNAIFTDHTYTNGAGLNLTNGTTFSAKCDATTVSTNSSNQLQSIGVIDKKSSAAVYTWKGTKAEYTTLGTYHNDWIYYITDEGLPTGSDYYTKTQVDTMLYNTNHSITKDTPYLKLKDTNAAADVTTAPGTAHNGGLIQFLDKNGQASGYIYTRYETNGNVIQYLQANKKVDGTAKETQLGIGIKADGTSYTVAPTPAASTSISDRNIATVGWVNDPNKATNVVHITGAETILGAKTFLGNNVFSGTDTFTGSTQFTGTPKFIGDSQNDAFDLKNTDDNYLLSPSQTVSTNITITDKNGEYTGGWEHYHQADGTCISQMRVRRQGADEYATLAIGIDTAGNSYCTVPTDTYGTNFHGISTRSQWADLAEKYESDKEYPAGTLIKFGGSKDITAADTEVNGVISDKPGYLLDSDLKDGLPVALAGKTPLRIVGKVNKFDKIVLSEIPGVGRVLKEGENLPVIARALASSNNTDEKLVMCVTKFNLG